MKSRAWIVGAAVAVTACGGSGGGPSGSAGTSTVGSTSAGSGGSGSSPSTGGSGGVTSSGSSGGSGGSGGMPSGPLLVVPEVIDVPYVLAGAGGSSALVQVRNDGDAPLAGLSWKLAGDPAISLADAPAALAAGEQATLTVDYAGASAEAIAAATLTVQTPKGPVVIPVFAAAGDPGLGAATWADVPSAGGVTAGSGATVAMPAAPYPMAGSTFTDPSVRVFLPEGYRDRGAQDLVVHFHGHSTTLADTLAAHRYQQHLYASGSNAVLVVPQGPVNTASGDFGKLMKPGGLSRLVDEVLVLLYREGKIQHPALGQVVLTSHSGGYQAVAVNLDPASLAPPIAQVNLFDSLYGYLSTYESYALAGGALRSNYTSGGGTLTNNQTAAAYLSQHGLAPATLAQQTAWRDAGAVIWFSASSHDGSTRRDGAYGEELRWQLPHSRRGPRIELRAAVAVGGMATVSFLAPIDEDVTGFVVEQSADGVTFTAAATVGPAAAEASFPLSAGARVRVKAIVKGLDPKDVLPSDTYRVDPQPEVLIVDGFDRVLDGSFGGLHHDFSAIVGEAAGSVATISHRAITEDGFDLASWPVVVWLLGDQSTADESLSPAEETALQDYVDAGGSLIVSGSELAYDLGQTSAGAAFLSHCFGAAYLADDSGSYVVTGEGSLAGVGPLGYAGPAAPYPEDYPDALSAVSGGQVLLRYGSGQAAAVGAAGKGAIVGFPLELVDDKSKLGAVVAELLAFVGG